MTDPYADRASYRSLVTCEGLRYFRVTEGESDLIIGASRDLSRQARQLLREARAEILEAIRLRPEFHTSLLPLEASGNEPPLAAEMLAAGKLAGAGPMAAVAGAVAERVGRALMGLSPNVVVENGGDIFLGGPHSRVTAIAAGTSPLSMRLGIRIRPMDGFGICTSSGTYGHSLSFGRADAAVVAAKSAAAADAAATILGNKCKDVDSLASAVEWAASLEGVSGAVAILGDRIAAAGQIELVRLNTANE